MSKNIKLTIGEVVIKIFFIVIFYVLIIYGYEDIIKIELPPDIKTEEVQENKPEIKEKLYNLLKQELKKNEKSIRQKARQYKSMIVGVQKGQKAIGLGGEENDLLPCAIVVYTKNGQPVPTVSKSAYTFPITDFTFTFTGWNADELTILQEVTFHRRLLRYP